jgi:hypothetical protein
MIYKDMSNEFTKFREMVSKLSCSDAIFWCARINLALNATGNEEAQDPLFQMLTTPREKYWLQKAFRKRPREDPSYMIFFRGQMLELIRWISLFCHDHYNDGSTFDVEDTRVAFFKCALLASEIWSRQTFGSVLEDEPDPDKLIQFARAPFRKGVEAAKNAPEFPISCGRGWIFYHHYFTKYYSTFNEDFLNVTGLTFEDYMVCFSAIAMNFMDPLKRPCIINIRTIGDTTLIPEKIKKYVQMESQTLGELRSKMWKGRCADEVSESNAGPLNTLILRDKPIYSTSDGRSIVMDPIYFHECVLASPMFHMITLNRKDHNQVFTAFGNAFEDYCCDILERMYPTRSSHTLLRQKNYQQRGNNIQIDAVIKQNNTAILFEIKASFIKESEVNLDGISFADEVRKKYSNVVENGQEKVKGVGQLSRTIKNIVGQNFKNLNEDFEEIKEIFPILLVHDNLLDTPLTIELLQDDFFKILERDLGYTVNLSPIKIHNLTIMTINDLENLENSVQHFNIIDLLRDLEHDCPVSIHNFVANSIKYGFYRNTHLLNTSIEILNKTREQLFNPMVE